MTLTTIFVRHGESGWNRRGLMQGQTDAPGLTTSGRAQAEHVAAGLAGAAVELVLTSDLRRARQTAVIVSTLLDVPLLSERRLRERNLGAAEGMRASPAMLATLGVGDGLVQDPELAPEGAEPVRELYRRVSALLVDLCREHPDQTLVLVTHGGVIRTAMHCAAVGGPDAGAVELGGMPWPQVENGSAWAVTWRAGRPWGLVCETLGP